MVLNLFMYVATGGRLPQSWYYENYTNIDMSNMNMRPNTSTGYPGRTYRFFTGTPIWEFGYGLSYSDFSCNFVGAPRSIMAPHSRHQLCSSDRAVMKSNLNCLDKEKGERCLSLPIIEVPVIALPKQRIIFIIFFQWKYSVISFSSRCVQGIKFPCESISEKRWPTKRGPFSASILKAPFKWS
jgi:hypothetical protein